MENFVKCVIFLQKFQGKFAGKILEMENFGKKWKNFTGKYWKFVHKILDRSYLR